MDFRCLLKVDSFLWEKGWQHFTWQYVTVSHDSVITQSRNCQTLGQCQMGSWNVIFTWLLSWQVDNVWGDTGCTTYTHTHTTKRLALHSSIGDLNKHTKDAYTNLGVILDCDLSFGSHINKTTKYDFGKIAEVRTIVSQQHAEKLVHAFVTNRLDYCNDLFSAPQKSSLINYNKFNMQQEF